MADAKIDNEIAQIRAQIRALTRRASHLSAALLSAQSTHSLLPLPPPPPPPPSTAAAAATSPPSLTDTSPFLTTSALALSKAHTAHAQESLYRLCAGCTMFELRDPNPHAVDQGRVFGVRIEVFTNGKFHNPYYIFLTRHPHLKVHKHTLPPSIPLAHLTARYLPPPAPQTQGPTRPQRLPALTRALRNSLTSHHLRLSLLAHLQRTLPATSRGRVRSVKDLGAEGRDVEVVWEGGRMGRVRLGGGGAVERCVVLGPGGRERGVEGRIMAGAGGKAGGEGLVRALAAVGR